MIGPDPAAESSTITRPGSPVVAFLRTRTVTSLSVPPDHVNPAPAGTTRLPPVPAIVADLINMKLSGTAVPITLSPESLTFLFSVIVLV